MNLGVRGLRGLGFGASFWSIFRYLACLRGLFFSHGFGVQGPPSGAPPKAINLSKGWAFAMNTTRGLIERLCCFYINPNFKAQDIANSNGTNPDSGLLHPNRLWDALIRPNKP